MPIYRTGKRKATVTQSGEEFRVETSARYERDMLDIASQQLAETKLIAWRLSFLTLDDITADEL